MQRLTVREFFSGGTKRLAADGGGSSPSPSPLPTQQQGGDAAPSPFPAPAPQDLVTPGGAAASSSFSPTTTTSAGGASAFPSPPSTLPPPAPSTSTKRRLSLTSPAGDGGRAAAAASPLHAAAAGLLLLGPSPSGPTSSEGGTMLVGRGVRPLQLFTPPPPARTTPAPPATTTAGLASSSHYSASPFLASSASSSSSILAARAPGPPPAHSRYTWALVCACNVNRSMSAHLCLTQSGFTSVRSYGTSDLVRLPSRTGPRIFPFAVPYPTMLRALMPTPEDEEWVETMGLVGMLQRDAAVKSHPEQWQALMSGGGQRPTSPGLAPQHPPGALVTAPHIASLPWPHPPPPPTSSAHGHGHGHGGSHGGGLTVLDHDFVLCFDARVYGQVLDDLRYRGMVSGGARAGWSAGLAASSPSAAAGGWGGVRWSSSPRASASVVPPARSVHVILLHTQDNLADAAVAGRQAAALAQALTAAAVAETDAKEREEALSARKRAKGAGGGAGAMADDDEDGGGGAGDDGDRGMEGEWGGGGGRGRRAPSASGPVVRGALRDLERMLGLQAGCLLHEEWTFAVV
jgi:hypothetical protein